MKRIRLGVLGRERGLDPGTLALATVVLVGLLYGFAHASDYGPSWDDPSDATYGETALRAYAGSHGYDGPTDRKYYGPLYWMTSALATKVLGSWVPSLDPADVRHFLNFSAYLAGLLAFYSLSRRLVSAGPALLASLLFASQPVFLGHAFINQKDIPFMSSFLVAIALGLKMADRGAAAGSNPVGDGRGPSLKVALTRGWLRSSRFLRAAFLITLLLAVLAWVDTLLLHRVMSLLQSGLASLYRGEGIPQIQRLFDAVAQDRYKTPLEAYAGKLNQISLWVGFAGLYLASLPALALGVVLAVRGGSSPPSQFLKNVLPAAAALGVALSIRVGGLFAGLLASLYFAARARRRSLPALAMYWLIALSVCYLTWPYLWGDPIPRFLAAVRYTSQFADKFVLFRGDLVPSAELPWNYLPTLLSIQLTEPALLLAAIGLVAVIAVFRSESDKRALLGLVGLWFLAPTLASALGRVPLYNNFRQVLFVLPPIFLVAGLGIALLWKYLRRPAWRIVFAGLTLLPGIVAIVRLHPYEYIYYNAMVGGVRGAEGVFAHDYWCTSIREAMDYVNAEAPGGATVAIPYPYDLAATLVRPDLRLIRAYHHPEAAFLVRCRSWGDPTMENLGEFPIGYAVTRSDVVLSIVWVQDKAVEGLP